jgi:8-amino-7-oxononanoate synthase
MPAFNERIQQALDARHSKGLTRTLTPCDGGNSTTVSIAGRNLLNFSNNDYLGLANDTELKKAFQQGIDVYGNGSAASPMVSGFSNAHRLLEDTLCDWLGFDRAVLLSSGFSANQALLFSLMHQGDTLIQDKLNHASLMEAGQLCDATMVRFRHNDIAHLKQRINAAKSGPTLVVTEGVFSMDGDQAPLAELQQATDRKAWLAVDDAHGIGVLGKTGGGSCEQANVRPDLLIVTFGKAFGLSGAAIMCNHSVGDYLTQFAKHHVYSTAFPAAQAFALNHAAKMIQSQTWRREKLAEHSDRIRHKLGHLAGYVDTFTPIKPFIIGDADQAVAVASAMRQHGIALTAIRPPTVPPNTARLRITVTTAHSDKQVETLCQALNQVVEE